MVCVGMHVLRHLKEKLAWAKERQLWVISNMYNVSYTTKKLKNKAILSLNNIVCVIWSLVTYSNCLVIYY